MKRLYKLSKRDMCETGIIIIMIIIIIVGKVIKLLCNVVRTRD